MICCARWPRFTQKRPEGYVTIQRRREAPPCTMDWGLAQPYPSCLSRPGLSVNNCLRCTQYGCTEYGTPLGFVTQMPQETPHGRKSIYLCQSGHAARRQTEDVQPQAVRIVPGRISAAAVGATDVNWSWSWPSVKSCGESRYEELPCRG